MQEWQEHGDVTVPADAGAEGDAKTATTTVPAAPAPNASLARPLPPAAVPGDPATADGARAPAVAALEATFAEAVAGVQAGAPSPVEAASGSAKADAKPTLDTGVSVPARESTPSAAAASKALPPGAVLQAAYFASKRWKTTAALLEGYGTPARDARPVSYASALARTFPVQLGYVLRRAAVFSNRNVSLNYGRFVALLFLQLIFGVAWYDASGKATDIAGIQTLIAAIFFTAAFSAMISACGVGGVERKGWRRRPGRRLPACMLTRPRHSLHPSPPTPTRRSDEHGAAGSDRRAPRVLPRDVLQVLQPGHVRDRDVPDGDPVDGVPHHRHGACMHAARCGVRRAGGRAATMMRRGGMSRR